MEKPPIHRSVAEFAKRSAVGIRKDRFTAKFGCDALESRSNFVESFVPGDALEGSCGAGALARDYLGPNSPQWIQHPVRRIDPVQVLGDFRTQESASDRMRGIALDFYRLAVVHRDQYPARVRAIMGTGGMNDLLHDF